MASPVDGASFLGTLGIVFLSITALFAVDTFLARTEKTESGVEAERLFEEGRALMQKGENAAAIERIDDAILIERDNRNFQRSLAEAQLAADRTSDAESTLNDLLESDSTDALASLIMARVLEKEDRFDEAVSFFHRAIYGRWGDNAAANRLSARFELIDLLAQRNSPAERSANKEELLAELLPVEEEAPHDPKTRLRIGALFLLAGSPARAADVFQSVLHDSPNDPDARAGLGQAEFAQGNYRAAQQDFEAALRLVPNDQATRHRLDLCNQLLTLDPAIRGLSSSERFRRSRQLLQLTMQEASQCAGLAPTPELKDLLDESASALKARVSAARESETFESGIDLAEKLWQARSKECKPPPDLDTPLALVLAKLAQ